MFTDEYKIKEEMKWDFIDKWDHDMKILNEKKKANETTLLN